MPMVQIKWYKGRTPEQKRKVAEAVEKAMQEVGVTAGVTHVVFHDIDREDWIVPGEAAERSS